jgi:hypothetical protein
MEYMVHYYYKYLDEKFAPDPPGSGYIKTKNHFELMLLKLKNIN